MKAAEWIKTKWNQAEWTAKDAAYGFMWRRFLKRAPVTQAVRGDQSAAFLYTTVAFNNEHLIEKQILCLRKFVRDFDYMAFDNSSDPAAADRIRAVCEKHGVSYVRLPENPFAARGALSESHACCINYIYYNYVAKSQYRVWIMLDHDIFPIIPFDAEAYLNGQKYKGMYEKKINNRAYIWPGFCLMDVEWTKGKKINFMPERKNGCDTGGKNSPLFTEKDYTFSRTKTASFDGNLAWGNNAFSAFDCGWIHCWNGSNYCGVKTFDKKIADIFSIIDHALSREKEITLEQYQQTYMKSQITEVL